MERYLQIILVIGTLGITFYIINKVRLGVLELRYTLWWLFTSASLFVLAVFPGIVDALSDLLHIRESVNTVFLLFHFFMMMIIFSLTKVLSKKSKNVTALAQEIGLLKLEIQRNLCREQDMVRDKKKYVQKVI